jgi:peptidoglycan/LPS O-acetylase OafA/YrhL
LLARLGASGDLIEEARLRNLPFWFAFMALGMLVGMSDVRRTLAGMIPLLCVCTATAYAIYLGARILGLGDSAAYDSTALFAYAALLCLTFVAAPLRSSLLGFVGSGSYFIYLWHIFVVMLLRDHGGWLNANSFVASATTYAAAVTASILALVIIRSVLPPRAAQWLGA